MHVALEPSLADDALRVASADRRGVEEFDELKSALPSWMRLAAL